MRRIIFMICMFCCSIAYSQEKSKVSFDYLIKPGDSEWQSLGSTYERNQALQIPERTLKTLSTEDLLEVCLNYPFLIEATFYSNKEDAIRYLVSKFNGFEELLSRKDVSKVLLKKEVDFPNEFKKLSRLNDSQKGLFSFQDEIVELLITQEDILASLNKHEQELLMDMNTKNTDLKKKDTSVFGDKNFLLSKMVTESQSKATKRIYKPKFKSITLYTPKGSRVQNAEKLNGADVPGATATQLNYLINYLYANYDGATLEENNTWEYNTDGWTWHTSRTGEKVLIDRANRAYDSIYVHDGSYIEVPEQYGTVVVYGDFYFSATKDNGQWYISKWGDGGPRVRHKLTALPNGSDSYFDNAYYHPNDAKTYYMPIPNCQISGNSHVCSHDEYSITNLPADATVQWSYSPREAGSICTNGSGSMTFSATSWYSGDCTLKADIFLAGSKILTVESEIEIGVPAIHFMHFTSAYGNSGQWTANSSDNHLEIQSYDDSPINTPVDLKIYRINNDFSIGNLVTQRNNVYLDNYNFGPFAPGWYSVEIRSHNECGYSQWEGNEIECVNDENNDNPYDPEHPYEKSIVINNTSADYIFVSFVDKESFEGGNEINKLSTNNRSESYIVQLWNGNKPISTSTHSGKTFQLNVSGLPKGIYMMRIINNDEVYSKKFIIR